ncbi:MAG: 16S rRNA (cytidine(1402)-2'-O)-methyltransferase, partial [Pseudomonadales bacterium]
SESAVKLITLLSQGQQVALVSDAGTPLVSDPGYRLIRSAIEAGIKISPVPGASAVLTALSVSGLPTDRFCFEGFLPPKKKQRESRLKDLLREPRTMVFFEAPHRIKALLADLMSVFGGGRDVSVSRELTKQFEQVWTGTVSEAASLVASGDIPEKGEFVVVVKGASGDGADYDEVELMKILLTEVSPATAASLASQILGVNRKHLYEVALSLKNR